MKPLPLAQRLALSRALHPVRGVPCPHLRGYLRPHASGAALARLRRAAGLSQTVLARRIGCGRHAVSYWETKPAPFRFRHGVPALIVAELAREGFEVRPAPLHLTDDSPAEPAGTPLGRPS